MPSTHFRNPKLEMRLLWRQRRRTIGRKKQSEGKMAMIVGGRRVGKSSYESSSSSSDLQEGPEKSLCLFVSGWGCPQLEGPMLYSVDLDGKSYKRRKLCRRCCREILGEPGPEPELDLDERLHLRRSSGGFRELTPLISTSSRPPGGSMVVALGSAVYILGGCISNTATDIGWLLSSEVSYFETNSPEKGWIPVPDMLNCRDMGAVVAVEGKIYVFGGNELDNAREPWAEVFDPIKNKWKPLCRPPKSLRNSNYTALNAVAYGEENKKILIGCMFVYDVNSNTWEILPAKDEGLAFVRRSYNNLVGVGNSLYWTRLGIIHVFNMKTRGYYVTKIEGIGNQICKAYDDPSPERLLHLGGKEFCLLTLDEIEGRRKRTKIRCYKFKVSKQGTKKDPGSFMASLVCRDGYIVDWPLDFRSDHGLVLDVKPGGKVLEEVIT